jgi:RHH-type proline utilization regulon transcriptional repressor/proline dehydrogenase/delta 1-pyrroline-5-carboxylate dehydrogenase
MNTSWPQPLPSGAPRLPFPYRAEAEVVSASLAALQGRLDWTAVMAMARPWVQGARATPAPFWAMESLLREYPISKPEGLALMRLAEALLRVPDVETAIALTADQLGRADFDASSTEGPHKMLASLSASAIGLSKRFLPDAAGEGGLLQRLGARTVVAATVRAIQLLGHQFVYARTIGDAVQQAQGLGTVRFSFDMLGEGARTSAAATEYLAAYQSAIQVIAQGRRPATGMAGPQGRDEISVKLSALYPRFEDAQRGRVMAELLPRLWTLVQAAAQADINLAIDAEECDRLELSLDLQEALAARVAAEHPQWGGLGLALQTYQTRALELVDEVAAMARRHRTKFVVRLVKGAYWDGEVKRAQEGGLPGYPVFTHKRHTDICYLASAARLIGHHDVIYPQFASHNAGTIAAIVQMARAAGAAFELQRLHGMGEGVHREVLKDKSIVCRVYAPVGEHRDLLAYLVRRLLENGANSSFVHQLADETWAWTNCWPHRWHRPRRWRCRCRWTCSATAAQLHGRGPGLCSDARAAAGRHRHDAARAGGDEPGGRRGGGDAAAAGWPDGLAGLAAGRARRVAAPRRRPAGSAPAGVLRAAGEGSAQDPGRLRGRSARGGGLLPLLRRPGAGPIG